MWKEAATPAYIFSQKPLSERVQQVQQAFGSNTELCFSIKANPFILPILPPEIRRLEVCSPGELMICERLGLNMKTVIFSGVHKEKEEILRALNDGVGTLTAESPEQIRLIKECAVRTGKTPEVLLRLTAGSQFGMEEHEILQVYRQAAAGDLSFQPVGIHFFSGTQKKKAASVIKELTELEAFIARLEEATGLHVQKLEYGTGLAVDYFIANADEAEAQRLEEISPAIRKMSSQLQLTVEMGRFFAAPCGSYVTKVVDCKINRGMAYAIVDGGIHQLKYYGQMQGMHKPSVTHFGQRNGEKASWTICGSLCTTGDVLASDLELSGCAIGDRLVFHRTGAYCVMEGMSSFLSRDLPSVYLEKEGKLILVREAGDTSLLNTPAIDLDKMKMIGGTQQT